ncbi:hypothetical protein E4T66_00550 [Sinimarinibacterium sp. CAU 1509]|uniref:M14 family metallopeptidase n=1 Tax=Sinimarinibacterium sp. CAU 1509 TaxID=2562283 RepID=UPI0010AB9429|nr:M14 family metallopeptidase [Sinimarinibacterium sp. CAU 1509]TJY64768.1 hypothetical protein E4T66_00550 [Sinimarinibacterium sp. CAU 1509]
MAALSRVTAALLFSVTATAAAQVLTLTEDSYGDTLVPLGYPVPLPVDSQTPVDGFRRYAALQARLDELALSSDSIREQTIGQTLAQRPITAVQLSDADALTAEGFAEPAALINGGIHAREWGSPEVVAALVEHYAERQNDGGLYRYLLDNLNLIVIPVLNVDGFLQTQRYPDTFLQTEYSGDPTPADLSAEPAEYRNYPRDGRFRRKNMRNVDETLCAAGSTGCVADGMLGVDLNRNNTHAFASGNQNSNASGSLVYHGVSAASEPEIQALYAAGNLGPAARLRLYVDTHTFSRVYYGVNTGRTRRDALARALAQRMSAATGGVDRYPYNPTPAGQGIGSTDERFAYDYQIPAYTLELEPSANGGSDYGSFGYHHDGFVLPASEIARVREEITAANTVGLYRMAGPPSLIAAQVRRVDSDLLVYDARWMRDGSTRALTQFGDGNLEPGVAYRLWLAFNKPMRWRDPQTQAITQFIGQSIDLAPQIALTGRDAGGAAFSFALATTAEGWRATPPGTSAGCLRYADDAYQVVFTLPTGSPAIEARRLQLAVTATDFTGQALDTNPATVADWAGGWANYEDDAGRADTDVGGSDRTLVLVDDGSSAAAGGSGGGGSVGLGSSLTLLLAAWLRRQRAQKSRGKPRLQ